MNGGKPYFSSIEFLRNIIKDPTPNNVSVFRKNEEVLFFNPNRQRAKIEEPFESAKHLTPHTILLRASSSNKYRLPTYRVIANPGQIKRMVDTHLNPLTANPQEQTLNTNFIHYFEEPIKNRNEKEKASLCFSCFARHSN